jgi:hypothetical protein
LNGRLRVRGFQRSKDVQCLVRERAPDKSGQIGRSVGHARPKMLEVQSGGILGDKESEENGSGTDVLWER